MCGSTKRRSMTSDARRCRISLGCPLDQRGDAALGVQAGLQHGVDLGGGEIAGSAGVEHHIERIERALGLPELIGNDADRVVARQVRQPRMLGAGVFVGDRQRRELSPPRASRAF
jgi:hypothetical protein